MLQPLPSLYSPLEASGVSCCAGENAAETSKETVLVYCLIRQVMKGLKQLIDLFYEVLRGFHEIFFFSIGLPEAVILIDLVFPCLRLAIHYT